MLPGFAQNMTFLIFRTHFSQINQTWKIKIGLIHWQMVVGQKPLKLGQININSIRGKKLELLAFPDFHQPQIVAIQETNIDSSISTSELFPESCPYNV